MARQSFWHRMKYGNHPGNKSRLTGFFFKLVIILLVLTGIGIFVFSLAVKSRVKSEESSATLAEATAEALSARDMTMTPLFWEDDGITLRNVRIEGGRESFFKRLDFDTTRFALDFMDVIEGAWRPSRIEFRGVDVSLRSGAFTDREWRELIASVADEEGRVKGTGGWLTPNVGFSQLRTIVLRQMDVSWGAKRWMAGSLLGCDAEATERNGVWTIRIEKGVYSQNWLKNLVVEKLTLEVDSAEIRVIEGKFRFPSGAPATMQGVVSVGGDPEFDLKVRVQEGELSDFLFPDKLLVLSGKVDGEFQLGGSPNKKEGVSVLGRLTANDSRAEGRQLPERDKTWRVKLGRNMDRELPVFRAFGDSLGVEGLRYFTAESSVIDFKSSEGNLEVTDLELIDPKAGKILSSFVYNGKKKSVEGQLKVVASEALFESSRNLRERGRALFPPIDGKPTLVMELSGSVENLTQKAAAEVRAAANADESTSVDD